LLIILWVGLIIFGGVNKKASLASHRYDRLPLLPSGPGGVQQELVAPDLRLQN